VRREHAQKALEENIREHKKFFISVLKTSIDCQGLLGSFITLDVSLELWDEILEDSKTDRQDLLIDISPGRSVDAVTNEIHAEGVPCALDNAPLFCLARKPGKDEPYLTVWVNQSVGQYISGRYEILIQK
jgi:hypothetical protein